MTITKAKNEDMIGKTHLSLKTSTENSKKRIPN